MKALVKLRFFNNRKERMLIERRLQVTRKKTGAGLTMKTLEGTISFVDSARKDKGVSPVTQSISIGCCRESSWIAECPRPLSACGGAKRRSGWRVAFRSTSLDRAADHTYGPTAET